jgi:hypothetical protein
MGRGRIGGRLGVFARVADASDGQSLWGSGSGNSKGEARRQLMRRLKVLLLVCSAVCVFAALTAGTAAAELPQLLNAAGTAVTSESYTGESGKISLRTLGGHEIACETSTEEGTLEREATSKGYLGSFHIMFNKCTSSTIFGAATCTGANEVTGTILVLGTMHLVYDILTTLGVGVLLLLNELHFTCSLAGVNELVLLKGSVICLIKPIAILTKHFEIVCKQSAANSGDPSEAKYWNAAGVEQKAELLSNVGETSFESAAWEGTGLILTTLEVKIDG